jgi:xanthine dehydrogenase accessory factor
VADDLLVQAYELRRRGEPFALATVVRCVRPTSAKPGAKAIIRKDGTVSGWVGGSCAEPVVVREGLQALRDGQPRFVALVGEGGSGPGRQDGVQEYPMSCHSGGTIEIFVEPVLPKPELLLIGAGPVIDTLGRLGRAMDFTVTLSSPEASARSHPGLSAAPNVFIVVASHGAFDEDALEQALQSEARYVSLVASRKRAAAVMETLRERGVPAERLARLKAPAGLDIGAVTPEEIAASILAEIIQVSRSWRGDQQLERAAPREAGEAEATDPVCGMSVKSASARYQSERSGRSFYFCCAGCKRKFDEEPARYAGSAAG